MGVLLATLPVLDEPLTFHAVYEAHASFVWRVVRRLGVREADVADVCQEVFVVVHRKLPDFEQRSSVRTWVYGIAARCASTHRRRAYVVREQGADVVEQAVAPNQGLAREQLDVRAQLDRLLDLLDDDKRCVFVLYELEELSMSDIADLVGCPVQTAYSRLHAARKLLADAAVRS